MKLLSVSKSVLVQIVFYHICIIDGDDMGLTLHFHHLGANAYYHAHQDLRLCNDDVCE